MTNYQYLCRPIEKNDMIIHKNSYGTWLLVWAICLPLTFAIFYFIPLPYISYPLACIPMFFMGFVTFFFRVPRRKRVGEDNCVTSVADGEIVVIERVYEAEHLKRECLQVSVYMDFFNVHVNYWPLDGNVDYYKYHPGKYMFAYLPKASELNEHTSVAIRSSYGDVFFKQIAGTFARRIVCYAQPGSKEIKGSQCGIIKFGSRIDMYLPLDTDVKVKIGDCVRGSETVIAELKK